jgi:hypothetical protein
MLQAVRMFPKFAGFFRPDHDPPLSGDDMLSFPALHGVC